MLLRWWRKRKMERKLERELVAVIIDGWKAGRWEHSQDDRQWGWERSPNGLQWGFNRAGKETLHVSLDLGIAFLYPNDDIISYKFSWSALRRLRRAALVLSNDPLVLALTELTLGIK